MGVFKKKSRAAPVSRAEALKAIPVKSHRITEEHPRGEEIVIHYPATMRPWIAGLVKRFGVPPNSVQLKKLQLDPLGKGVWELIDGARSVQRITELFAAAHRLPQREAEAAVTQFLRQLGQRGLIGMR